MGIRLRGLGGDGVSDDAPATVLVVDDHPLYRRGVVQVVEAALGFQVVGQAADGTECLVVAERLRPDLILLDVRMPGLGGIDTLRALRRAGNPARVVMLTVSMTPDDVAGAAAAGADGYLTKDAGPEQIITALRGSLARRAGRVGPGLPGVVGLEGAAQPADSLTDRERAVLACLAAGQSNKWIARTLEISEGTVKVHLRNVKRKMGFRSRLELALWVVEQQGGGAGREPD